MSLTPLVLYCFAVFNARQVHAYATLSNSASVDSGEGGSTPVDGTSTTLGTDNTTVSAIGGFRAPVPV